MDPCHFSHLAADVIRAPTSLNHAHEPLLRVLDTGTDTTPDELGFRGGESRKHLSRNAPGAGILGSEGLGRSLMSCRRVLRRPFWLREAHGVEERLHRNWATGKRAIPSTRFGVNALEETATFLTVARRMLMT